MLAPYIIEEIKRREREQENQLPLQIEEIDPFQTPLPISPESPDPTVIVIDLL